MEAGIDAIIFSIDGYKKETHESLRKGAKFENVISNVKSVIRMRNEGGYKTRFIVRFILQKKNAGEWKDYYKFWSELLSKEKGDKIINHPLHNWAGQTASKNDFLDRQKIEEIEKMPCSHYTDLLYILSDGTVPLCHEDNPNPIHIFGNVNEQTPLEIFNSPLRRKWNEIHRSGKKNKSERCKNCTILYSEAQRKILDPDSRVLKI